LPESGVRPADLSGALREALEGEGEPHAADDILYEAMVDAEIAVFPSRGRALAELVNDFVLPRVATTLGPDARRRAEERLAPMLRIIGDRTIDPGAHATFRPDRSTWVPPHQPTRHPLHVITMDARVVTALRERLSHVAEISTHTSVIDLVRTERAAPSRRPSALFVDCRAGALGAPPAHYVLRGAPVVLWLATPLHREQLERSLPDVRLVGECSRDVPVADAALLVRHALGQVAPQL
jgi:hypothetical protein